MFSIPTFLGRSFRLKVLLPVAAVTTLLVITTLWVVDRHFSNQVHATALEQLDTSDRIFNKTLDSKSKELVTQYRNVLNEPRLRAVTKQADFETLKYSISEIMQEAVTDNQATIAAFTFFKKGSRQQICSNSQPGLDESLFLSNATPSIVRSAQGQIVTDIISVDDSIFQVVSLPVGSDYDPAGVLTFGVRIDPALAHEIHQLTQSEVVFVANGKISAGSLRLPATTPWLNNLLELNPSIHRNATQAEPVELEIDHEHFLGQSARLTSLKNDNSTGYLLLSSYEKAIQNLHEMQQLLVLIGCIGLGGGLLVIWLVVNGITAPLRDLQSSVEAVGNDDFSRQVRATSSDEVGRLADSFNQMVIKVKSSRESLQQTVETLKTTQSQLIQSEKLAGIGEFVAGVAHELNNPLTSVMGFSELLQQGELPEQHRRYLDVILKSAKRCQKIVQSLLSFARRHTPERKVICANEIIESAIDIMSYQLRSSNVDVHTHLDPALPPTELDSHQIQQVFINLINNARQAMEAHKAGGCLNVFTESSGSKVKIIFKDNGPGITPENLKKIFNPFFTTKAVGKGTGLGLSLCYGIISEHGGTITPSSGLGEGATFTIELPISKGAVTSMAPQQNSTPGIQKMDGIGKRVLVIDDEDAIVQMISEVLTNQGYKVDVALDGETALKKLNQCQYDLALCDWRMPGVNGRQIYEKLEETKNEMSKRFIFITGDVVNEKTQEFLRSRNKLCISKPFTLDEFSSAIGKVTDNARN